MAGAPTAAGPLISIRSSGWKGFFDGITTFLGLINGDYLAASLVLVASLMLGQLLIRLNDPVAFCDLPFAVFQAI